jgi:hypothetical protein
LTTIALGYCSGCRMPVELNERGRCPLHPGRGITDIQLVPLEESETARGLITHARLRRIRRELIGWLIALLSLSVLGYVLLFMVEY